MLYTHLAHILCRYCGYLFPVFDFTFHTHSHISPTLSTIMCSPCITPCTSLTYLFLQFLSTIILTLHSFFHFPFIFFHTCYQLVLFLLCALLFFIVALCPLSYIPCIALIYTIFFTSLSNYTHTLHHICTHFIPPLNTPCITCWLCGYLLIRHLSRHPALLVGYMFSYLLSKFATPCIISVHTLSTFLFISFLQVYFFHFFFIFFSSFSCAGYSILSLHCFFTGFLHLPPYPPSNIFLFNVVLIVVFMFI